MTEKLKQTIEEEVSKLPVEIQEAITASNWVQIIEIISRENGLDEEETTDFQLETLLTLIGATDIEFYAINIENHVNTTKEKAEKLAKEGLEKIFGPIKKVVEDRVKKDMENKNPNWKQNMDFVLSGGDYSAFLKNNSPEGEEYRE